MMFGLPARKITRGHDAVGGEPGQANDRDAACARAPIHEPALSAKPCTRGTLPSPARARATSGGRRRALAANAIDPDTQCLCVCLVPGSTSGLALLVLSEAAGPAGCSSRGIL